MQLQIGRSYSRSEISEILGGSIRASLPVSKGAVVCGCFKKEPKWNPQAPEEVTLGVKPRVHAAARTLAEQGGPIPIFLFRKNAAWEYKGDYRCIEYSTDEKLCRQKMEENPVRGRIGGVLRFETSEDQPWKSTQYCYG